MSKLQGLAKATAEQEARGTATGCGLYLLVSKIAIENGPCIGVLN